MANPTLSQKKNGKYLWCALLGLGFQPDIAISSIDSKCNSNPKHINLGPNMFDKPNKDAFYIVTYFLLEKLNKTRFQEAYRHCWPILTHKADADFRKVTCAWLKEIMDETANAGSKVVASLFLSPGGSRFTSLMLDLACHVMLQDLKTFSTDGSWVPDAAAMPASSVDMAVKRCNLIRTRFLKTAQDQDHFLHEYQRRAQLLVKSMKDIKADGAKYDELLKRHSTDDLTEGETSPAKKTKRIRFLWLAIDEMLSTIKEEQNAMASVLQRDEDSNILDGTHRPLKIPRCLLERIEQLPRQLRSGKVYEAGQLNLLCVMELMNHALQLLREECCLVSQGPTTHLSSQHLLEKRQQMDCVLHNLQFLREKISKEELPEVRNSIRNLLADWDKKWTKTLKDRPLVSFLNEDPALGFLSPIAPLSFEPLAEASYRSSVFSQYPAKLLEEKPAERKLQEDVHPGYCDVKSFTSALVERIERTESPLVTTEASRANTSLDWLFETTSSPPLKAPPVQPAQASVRKTTHVNQKVATVRTKAQILEMECDNLADQFADAVTAASPSETSDKCLDLEGLLSTLQRDPFSTRKQLPRTPESLIMDVKSSWRKAVAEEGAKKNHKSSEFANSVAEQTSPFNDSHNVLVSPDAPSETFFCSVRPTAESHGSPPVCQQGLLHKSTLLWDTFNTEALDNSSGRGTVVQFSLDHETLPELPSCDSLLSVDDEAVHIKSDEDDEFLIPSLKAKQSPSVTRHHLDAIQQTCSDGLLMRTPESLLSDYKVSGLDRDWLMDPATSGETPDKVFSLDFDSLEMPSPPKKQDYSLPKLITFSPIDDMKC
ncbi:HAUS augmin-like complex subunit 6 [Parambassis ranga]|uniref:HAUS augmin-like complex subunit 6 n=1 Tax=Parambassis ranga TaxID=210632 RepID=A0A6P7K723_9TELE|nr:HAUS augmin-like complex subunit 6 [Parambassis ranga]